MKSILLSLVLCTAVFAQVDYEDYLYLPKEKRYVTAGVEVFGINTIVWGVNKFLLKEDWADITPESWKRNLKSSFVFDNDPFETNQFLHPYHGSMYFNAARANGLTFWESVPYTVGGSLMWEYFGETTLPSKNDLIGTTMGGVALGEILFRLSNLVLDESKSGSDRFWNETAALFISPIHGINRMIFGRTTKDGVKKKNPPHGTELAIGLNNIAADNVFSNLSSQVYIRLKVSYGNLYEDHSIARPYNSFYVHIGGNIAKNSKVPEVFAQGILTGKDLNLHKKNSSVAGIFQHYHYIDWNDNQTSVHSIGGGIENELHINEDFKIRSSLHLAYVALGGSNLYFDVQNRTEYNFSTGIHGKADLIFVSKDFGRLLFSYYPYWLTTINPYEGEEFTGIITAEYDYPIFTTVGGGIEYKLYRRWGEYEVENGKSVSDLTSAIRVFARFSF